MNHAYEVSDEGEPVGVVFAGSLLGAHLRGAAAFNEGEMDTISAKRAEWADQYGAAHLVPAAEMAARGIAQHCSVCRVNVGSDAIGNQHGRVYCDETCRKAAVKPKKAA